MNGSNSGRNHPKGWKGAELPDPPSEPVTVDADAPQLPGHLDWTSSSYKGGRRTSRGRKRRKHWYRPRNTLGIPLLVILLLIGFLYFYLDHELGSIRRAPLDTDFNGPAGKGTNVLLIASNSSGDALTIDRPTAVVQLLHLSADGTQAAVINVPRDLTLTDASGRSETLLDAYDQNGDPAVARLVQSALGLTVDHVSQASFDGYVKATDTLGDVELPTPQGKRTFTGSQARDYTSAGDVSSVVSGRRDQEWLKAMFSKTFTPRVILDPFTLLRLLRDATPNLVLDETFTNGAMRGLLLRARHLRPSSIRYLTVPYRGYAQRHGQKVLLPDVAGMRQLGAAVRADNASGIAVFEN